MTAIPAQRLIFSANVGRSGSGYLAKLLGSVPGVDAGHERLPAMVGAWARRVFANGLEESFEARRIKSCAIKAELSISESHTYVDTSHMFVKTFADVVAHDFPAEAITVVSLRRNVIDLVGSFFELDEFGPIRGPWHDFLQLPTSPSSRFRLDLDEVESQFDLIFGYLVDQHIRVEELRGSAAPWTWVDAQLEVITTIDGAQELLSTLGLVAPDDLQSIVEGRVNEKRSEKQLMQLATSEDLVRQRLEGFLDRFWGRPGVADFAYSQKLVRWGRES